MKPLILVILITITADAQTVADYARQERLRRAQLPQTRVYTNDDAQGVTIPEATKLVPPAPRTAVPPASGTPASTSPADAAPAVTAPPSAAATSGAAPRPAVQPARPADPAQKYREDVEKLRVEIRALQDQETALQLQLGQLTNQFFAPVTDEATRSQAQVRLGDAQNRLTTLRGVLDQTRRTLAAMEAQGPPR